MQFGRGGMGAAVFAYGNLFVMGGETNRNSQDSFVEIGLGVYKQVHLFDVASGVRFADSLSILLLLCNHMHFPFSFFLFLSFFF
jgi:hypothetical protein